MKLGFIGFGEAAFEMAKGLKGEGLSDIIVFDIMYDHPTFGPALNRRVEESGVKLVYSAKEVVEKVELLIVAVPGSKALETAASLHEFLHRDIIYVDVSASTVDVQRKIWNLIKDKTNMFVDVAMLGSLPMHQHRVPIVASGSGLDEFINLMEPYGMSIEKVNYTPGDATSIKLARSVFMKGLASLLLEVVDVSSNIGVTDSVIKSISNSIDEVAFEFTINRLIKSSITHAERRVHEMEGAIEMLEDIGVEPMMTQATKSRLEWLTCIKLSEKSEGQIFEELMK